MTEEGSCNTDWGLHGVQRLCLPIQLGRARVSAGWVSGQWLVLPLEHLHRAACSQRSTLDLTLAARHGSGCARVENTTAVEE